MIGCIWENNGQGGEGLVTLQLLPQEASFFEILLESLENLSIFNNIYVECALDNFELEKIKTPKKISLLIAEFIKAFVPERRNDST